MQFQKHLTAIMKDLKMDAAFAERFINQGFSGGEKKKAEILQMTVLRPMLALMDETDSGLDIDALRIVGDGINRIMRGSGKGVLLITHYERLLEYVHPDRVHVLVNGRVVRSGDIELARELERQGYAETAA
jgi:Fe-S cluster assembly ATP-binding protein